MSVRIIHGDVRTELPKLAADYFDCIVTSPPYYGLRDYGTATWEGGDPACDHCAPSRFDYALNAGGLGRTGALTQRSNAGSAPQQFRSICKCGARRIDAQIGLEPTLDAYLETIVAVCRELRRVLKPSGVFFLNIGDSYAGGGGYSPNAPSNVAGSLQSGNRGAKSGGIRPVGYLKPKDLCLVPEHLGIALQRDGWWVRSHIIWAKKNCMPESVTDRPTSAHETVWMLTKSARYFWDGEAVKEDASTFERQRSFGKSPKIIALEENGTHGVGGNLGVCYDYRVRNIRNVWSMASHAFPGAHFATFPPELVERCIKAACPRDGYVLDPFAGAGTTGLVADRLGRDCTLIDLNISYINMSANRIRDDAPLFADVAAE